MAYEAMKELITGKNGRCERDVRDEQFGDGKENLYIDRLWVLNSFLDMVGCCLSVARHQEEIDFTLHPLSSISGGKPHKLIDSTIEVLAWIQDVMFDDRKNYNDKNKE